jgi:hypothetical protein
MAAGQAVAWLAITGIISVGWFVLNLPALSGPFAALGLVLVGPYGLIGLGVLAASWGLRTGRRRARSLGIAGSAAALAWASFDLLFIHQWPSLLASISDPNVSYNWLRPEIWVGIPVALGALMALVGLVRPSARGGKPEPHPGTCSPEPASARTLPPW